MTIQVIDYGVGNLGSILNMLKKVGAQAEVTSDPARILTAERIILPGVGAFDSGMENLERRGLRPALDQVVQNKRIPILGICLGMQLFFERSDEGKENGLGWLKGKTQRFTFAATANTNANPALRIPHMGWNNVRCSRPNLLFSGLEQENRFYFVHSYHVQPHDPNIAIGLTEYGYEFCAACQVGLIAGVQFHPEKSHRFGQQLLKNFAEREWWL